MKTDNHNDRNAQTVVRIVSIFSGFFALSLFSACASLYPSAHTSATTGTTSPALPASPTANPARQLQADTNLKPADAASAALLQGNNSTAALPGTTTSNLEMSLMRIEIISLKEKMASVQRKLDLLLKAQRSGLYEPEDPDTITAAVRNAEPKQNVIPPLGSEGPIDRFENDFERNSQNSSLNPESAQKLVDRALTELAQGDFARVAQSLDGFQQRVPSHPLSNSVALALAEAYVELKSPQQALPHLRSFYLQHPNDVQLHRAKWLEARVQELLEAPQKASQLYREVIALSPQSDVALRARAALERINGGSMQ